MKWAGWVSVVLGIGVGWLCFWLYGLHLLVPVTVCLVSAALLRVLAPPRVQPLVAGVSVLWGHQAWILLGLGVVGAPGPWALAVETAPCAALLFLSAFLLSRPSSRWIVLINLLMALLLLVNVGMFFFAPPEVLRLPLSLHILLRCAAPILLNLGWERFTEESLQAEPPRPPAFQASQWIFLAALLLTIWSRALAQQALLSSSQAPVATRSLTGRVNLVGDDDEVRAYTRADLRVNGQPVELNSRGEYSVPDATQDELQLSLRHEDSVENAILVLVAAEKTDATVAPELKLTLLGHITGTVGAQLYAPVPEALIEIASLGINTRVLRDGRFSIGPVPSGDHEAVISAPGHEPLHTKLWASPGKPDPSRNKDLELLPEHNVHGCVPTASAPGSSREVLKTRLPEFLSADGGGGWRLLVHPCRSGVLTDVLVRASPQERPHSTQAWSAVIARAVGIAQVNRPGTLMNEDLRVPVRVPAQARRPLRLYVKQQLERGVTYEVWLRYEDGSYDLALLLLPR